MGCHALLWGIFLIQGLNRHLLDLPALASGFFTTNTTWEALSTNSLCVILRLGKSHPRFSVASSKGTSALL